MEGIIFLPMSLLFKYFVNKNDKPYEIVMKYLSVCFINSILCALVSKFYFHNEKIFENNVYFFLSYALLSIIIGIIMTIIYKIFINFWKVKIEVVNEKESKRS